MKLFIRELLKEVLEEAEFNYHIGNLGDDLKNIEPYGSDTLVMMQGRGTGHFGSGLYFSTYNCDDKRDFSKEYSDVEPTKSKLTEFPKAYRINFDIYKNLFRVKSEQHGEILFKTLKLINESFYLLVSVYDAKFEMDDSFAEKYLKIKHNADKLGLKIPEYRSYIKMIQKAADDLKNKTNFASMSTRIMEYNGFNGVNVSGIPMYDNTLHGSVIYDLAKVSDKPIPVKNPDYFCRLKRDVAGDDIDIQTRFLRGEKIPINKILELPKNIQMMVIKRIKYYLEPYELDKLDNNLKKLYYNSLQQKFNNNVFDSFPSKEQLVKMIEDKYINLIYKPNIKIDDTTLLEEVFDILWKFDDDTQNYIIKNINRELNQNEKIAYERAIN